MNHYLAAALLGWTLGRNDVVLRDYDTPPQQPDVPVWPLYGAIAAFVGSLHPSWSPEADLRRSVVHALVGTSLDYRINSPPDARSYLGPAVGVPRNDFVADLGTIIEHRFLKGEMVLRRTSASPFSARLWRMTEQPADTTMVVGQANDKALHIALEYRLLWRDRRWVVYDLVTDGDSLVESYRAQFDRIIARESFAGLKRRWKISGRGRLR